MTRESEAGLRSAENVGREGERGEQAVRHVPDCEWKFHTLCAALSEVVVTLDNRGRIQDWNGPAEALFGYSAGEAVGRDFFGLVAPGRSGLPLSGEADGAGRQIGFLATRKGGEAFPLEMTFFGAGSALGGGALGLLREPLAEGIAAAMMSKDMRRVEEAVRRQREQEQNFEQQRRRDERLIWQLMHHDALSGLPNRVLLLKRLGAAMLEAGEEGRHVGVLVLGIHHFAYINDVLGRGVGDFILTTLAAKMSECVGSSDTVARLEGDTFAVVLPHLSRPQETEAVAKRLLDAVQEPTMVAGHELVVSASIGIALFPRDGTDAEELVRNASAAMGVAKEEGSSGWQTYAAEYDACALARLALEEDLRRALVRGELEVHYQPQVNLHRGVIEGAEALLRWRRPGHGMVSPADFIPLAEESGLIVPIGTWVLEQACLQARAWQRAGAEGFRMAVNLSPRQFQQNDLGESVEQLLKQTRLRPETLELEITESLLMGNSRSGNAILRHFKEQGVRLALDDFGTGYSSLNYLRRFPVDTLKIDQSFVQQIPGNEADTAIVQAIIALAHGLQLDVVAEGVETEEQLNFLRAHGCDSVQGYLFSPPLEAQEFEKRLS